MAEWASQFEGEHGATELVRLVLLHIPPLLHVQLPAAAVVRRNGITPRWLCFSRFVRCAASTDK